MSKQTPTRGDRAGADGGLTRRRFMLGAGGVAVAGPAALASGCGATTQPHRVLRVDSLVAPGAGLTVTLEHALLTRRSHRQFTTRPLSEREVSQLLWSAQGVTASWGGRTAPSAGALYPLELYLLTPDGLRHYLPAGHRVELLTREDLRAAAAAAALHQPAVRTATLVIVVTAVFARTTDKYGERGRRYVHLEAGHAAQNALLAATALGLGSVPIGAFDDQALGSALKLPSDHAPLYLIAIGHPR